VRADPFAAAVLRGRFAQDRLAARLAGALGRYFDHQAAHAVALYLLGAVPIPDEWTVRLMLLFDPHVRAIVAAADAATAALLGAHPDPGDVHRLRAILADVGARARMMTEETRNAVRRVVAEGIARGYHPSVIARGAPVDGFRGLRAVVAETYRGRAYTIARTETALVWQATAHDRYGRAGVTRVRILDGAGCGWTSHGDADKANGSVRTLAEAARYPISHPNCVRASAPIVERGL
jgi:hypothetical protein